MDGTNEIQRRAGKVHAWVVGGANSYSYLITFDAHSHATRLLMAKSVSTDHKDNRLLDSTASGWRKRSAPARISRRAL